MKFTKRILPLLCAAAVCFMTMNMLFSCGEEEKSVGFPFNEKTEQAFNYCPSVFVENGSVYCYYCSNKESGVIQDHIYLRIGKYGKDGQIRWGEKILVLAPSFGEYDAFHCCDPSVIKGEFSHNGKSYRYLMAYTGNTSNVNNKIGLAVSNDPVTGWVKVKGPFIAYGGDVTHWGVGQPELLSVDEKGTVMLFYSVGSTSTYMMARKYDLSDLNDPKLISSEQISVKGLYDLNGNADVMNNAGVAYDKEKKRYYFVSDCHPAPTDGDPLFVSSHFRVTYISEKGGIGDAFLNAGAAGQSWSTLKTVGEAETNFKRNSNCAIVRSPFGYTLSDSDLEIYYSMSNLGTDYTWSYRIYSYTIAVNE
ncbi:MAG: hypothetical protein IJU84_01795 [Clostridia bacterium]|nr:hypothetical protein [Clostridia bacterium]